MRTRKLQFCMPAAAAVVFDAFHYHLWRSRWDSLVSGTEVQGGAPCPYVGAITVNQGRGWMSRLTMQTCFVSFNRPRVAAAAMIGTSFPFIRWAASMRHQDVGEGQSLLIYTYNFEVGPRALRWLLSPLVKTVFLYQTRRRFARLRAFLARHGHEVLAWQQTLKP